MGALTVLGKHQE